MEKLNIFSSDDLLKNNNIKIVNNSDDEMKLKAQNIINQFKNEKVVKDLKKSLNMNNIKDNSIFSLQDKMKTENPENFNKTINLINNFIKQSEDIRMKHINNFKITNNGNSQPYKHESKVAQYAFNPKLQAEEYKKKLQDFSSTYSKYISTNLPHTEAVKDENFC
jgi:hypothetical protein